MTIKPARVLREEALAEQQAALEAVRAFAKRAVETWNASAVYLFGSRARDDWRRGSDADVFVISERFEGLSQYERAVELSRLWDGPVGCEPMGFTAAEWEQRRGKPGIVSMALDDGLLQLHPEECRIREGLHQQRAASPGAS
jgi:uncharacterized protein